MDAVKGRRTAKSARDRRAGSWNRDRRRAVQLIASALLFAVVFFGRMALPEQVDKLGETVSRDFDMTEYLQTFGKGVREQGGLWKLFVSRPLGSESSLPSEPVPEVTDQIRLTDVPKPGRLGIDLSSRDGLLARLPMSERSTSDDKQGSEEIGPSEPVPVTAVAQATLDDGTKLPSNVSFIPYELGLERTAVPVFGEVTSGFGYRTSPITGKREFHLALDIAAGKGTEIAAFADGVVRYIGESDEFGLYFMIDHANGVSTFYAHCSKLMVRKGESVSCGQTVALVGNTGNATGYHLHLTILKDGIRLDPAHYVSS